MARETLPNRRVGHTFTMNYGAKFDVSIGVFNDQRPSEVFVYGGKVGG